MSNLEMMQPRVVLPREVFEKIMYFVDKAGSSEVSGIGVTEIVGADIVVRDVLMAKQSNSGSSTDMTAEAVASLMYKFHRDYPTLEANYWWHSHASMGVFWSGTDKSTIAQLGGAGMCVATVFNNKRENLTAIAATNPFPFFIDKVQLIIDPFVPSEAVKNAWDAEYDENVQKFFLNTGHQRGLEDWRHDEWEQLPTGGWAKKQKSVLTGTTGGEPINPLSYGSHSQQRWDWAHNRDEVADYDSRSDRYQLIDYTWVDADQYQRQISAIEGNRKGDDYADLFSAQ